MAPSSARSAELLGAVVGMGALYLEGQGRMVNVSHALLDMYLFP